MLKIVTTTVLAACAAIPTIAAAHDVQPQRFTRDGETYVYTTTVQNARQVIDGYSETNGVRFHLVVNNGIVSGTSGSQPVSFRVGDAASAITLASR